MVKKLQVYEAPSITVSFDPNVCRHTGVCVRTLPSVFDTRRTRRVEPAAAFQFYYNLADDYDATARLARRVLVNQLVRCMAQTASFWTDRS